MTDKRPIDVKRESSGMADIGTQEDGAIIEMYDLNGRLIIIKEKAIYELIMADKIDPERKNIELPKSIQRLVINQGAHSELVSRTFLTAKTLFRPDFFIGMDIKKVVSSSLDLLTELIVLEKEITDYLVKEKVVSDEYDQRRTQAVSYVIPSIGDVETRCKTIFQKADHIEQILMEIIIFFYYGEEWKKQFHFPQFYEILKVKYGEDDPFTKFVGSTIEFMKVIRELRNSLDHRLEFAKVNDFELQADSKTFEIISPTIELNNKRSKLERQALSSFLPIVLQNMMTIFEMTMVYLSSKTTKSNYKSYQIKEIPEETRRYKLVRYSFWTSLLGEGYGFFHQ